MRFSIIAGSIIAVALMSGCGSDGGQGDTAAAPTTPTPVTPTTPVVVTPTPADPEPTATNTDLNPPLLASLAPSDWAFNRPALATLRASPKKVFAHYLPTFPRSIDNKDPAVDYYTAQYLSPAGESGKHAGQGGFIRERPPGRAAIAGTGWEVVDCKAEVQRAAELGLDGFTYDILTTDAKHKARLSAMLSAMASTDAGFKMVLMPDMTAEFATTPGNLLPYLKELLSGANNSSLYRLADGRVVIAPYYANRQTPAWWKASILDPLAAAGYKVAFMPLFASWRASAAAYASISWGMTDWGSRYPSATAQMLSWKADSQAYTGTFMIPVGFSDVRPNGFGYTETEASAGCRSAWNSAIAGKADWVQLVTWNDYAESSEMQPSSGIQGNAYKLNAYYITWFKTGSAPAVARDQLMYLHRTHPVNANPDLTKQTQRFTRSFGTANVDIIELVGYLTRPGTLSITIDGVTTSRDVGAGLQVMTVPLRLGRPQFTLKRDGRTVIAVASEWSISDKITYQDLIYRGADSTLPSGVAMID